MQRRDFLTVSGILLRSRLAFNANDSSYVFKILGSSDKPVFWEKQGSPSDIITLAQRNK